MKIIVTSRNAFPEAVRRIRQDPEKWACISIENTGGGFRHFLPDGPDTLNLDFDDVDADSPDGKLKVITEEQASRIVEFAENHSGYNLLVHCTAGRSRSQGVARALRDMFPENWSECPENRRNPCITPNIAVCAAIKRAVYKKSDFFDR